MSLVTVWTNERFAAVCCDGRLSQRAKDGQLTPVGEHYPKFHVLTEEIVFAVTGSDFVNDGLARYLEAFALEHSNSPDLFMYLEAMIPSQVRNFLAQGTPLFDAPLEAAVVLIGYDAAQKRIRNLSWNSHENLVPLEQAQNSNTVGAIGNDDGVPIARDRLIHLRDSEPALHFEDVLPAMESIVADVSDLVPWSINKNTRSYLVVVPDLRSERKAKGLDKVRSNPAYETQSAANEAFGNVADGTRAAWTSVSQKAAAVDSSGNLLLKNVNDAVGVTIGPSTTSTTYSVIPELTQTLTFKGNKVLLAFTLNANMQNATSGVSARFAIFKDGVQLSQDYEINEGFVNDLASGVFYPVSNNEVLVAITFIDSPSAASHTYDVRWRITGGGPTLYNLGTARRFQIVELG